MSMSLGIFLALGVAILLGIALSRVAYLRWRVKRDEQIMKLTDKINRELNETREKISNGDLSDADAGKLLSTFQDD